jgi:hypothetical protein
MIPDTMQVLVFLDNPQTYNLRDNVIRRVPDEGMYYQALQDVWSGEWFDQNGRACPRAKTRNYKKQPYDGLPSTIQMWGAIKINEFFPLNAEWQKFWLDLIDRATGYTLDPSRLPYKQLTPKHLLYWWIYATQESLALTDNHSAFYHGEPIPNGAADYILGLNIGNSPISIKSLSMTGNIFKRIGKQGDNYIVETINAGTMDDRGNFFPARPPSVDEVWGKHWLIHWGVESTTMPVVKGGFVQSAFPPKPFGLPFPVMGIDGKNIIRARRVVPVKNGDIFSPYYP